MNNLKQELIEIRQDDNYEEIRPIIRKAIAKIESLEKTINKSTLFVETALNSLRGRKRD